MPEPEVRHPCPVCLGVKLSKVRFVPRDLVLDRCQRCGGIWFDQGEVEQLRKVRRGKARRKIVLTGDAFHMQCHSCRAVMDRNAERCPVCQWRNVIDCPVCTRVMERREVEGLHLDVCAPCRGVWFDRIELAEIWNLRAAAAGVLGAAAAVAWQSGGESGEAQGIAADAALDTAVEIAAGVADTAAEVLIWNPDLLVTGGRALSQGARAAAELISEAPEVLGAVAEAGGDLAGSVFEVIAGIIEALFS